MRGEINLYHTPDSNNYLQYDNFQNKYFFDLHILLRSLNHSLKLVERTKIGHNPGPSQGMKIRGGART